MIRAECCNGDCQQGRTCPAQSTRWPVFCTRRGSTDHYAEDCTRMPALMGLSQQERDHHSQVRQDRMAFALCVSTIILALLLFGLLEAV